MASAMSDKAHSKHHLKVGHLWWKSPHSWMDFHMSCEMVCLLVIMVALWSLLKVVRYVGEIEMFAQRKPVLLRDNI